MVSESAPTTEARSIELTIQEFEEVLYICPHIASRMEGYDVVSASVEVWRDGTLFCIVFRSSNSILTLTADFLQNKCNLAVFEMNSEGEVGLFSEEFGRLIELQEVPECLEEMSLLLKYTTVLFSGF